MLYEDLIYLWISYLVFEFFPLVHFLKGFVLPFIFFTKECVFILFLLFFRQRILKNLPGVQVFLEKLFIFLIFFLYFLDLGLFNLKYYLNRLPFSSLLGFLWFLHYFILIKIFLFRFSFNYLKLLLGLISPILILVVTENIMDFLNFPFKEISWVLFLLIFLLAPLLMVKFWPVYPLEDAFLKELISSFLEKNRVKIRKIYVLGNIGKKVYTAGVIGLFPGLRYLFFSKDLLELLTPEEILGVLSHEIGHIKKKHGFWLLLLLINMPLFLFSTLFLIVFLLSQITPQIIKFLNHQSKIFWEFSFGIYFIILSFIYIRYIFAYFLRQFEREADLYSLILNTAQPLISALFKIGHLTGQLFKKSWHHYGISERIEFLANVLSSKKAPLKRFFRIRVLIVFWVLFNFFVVLLFYSEKLFEKFYRFISYLL